MERHCNSEGLPYVHLFLSSIVLNIFADGRHKYDANFIFNNRVDIFAIRTTRMVVHTRASLLRTGVNQRRWQTGEYYSAMLLKYPVHADWYGCKRRLFVSQTVTWILAATASEKLQDRKSNNTSVRRQGSGEYSEGDPSGDPAEN
jgi:hypothetical protein